MEDRVVNKTVAKPNETLVRRFKPYPAYKEPGVHWLGDIPAHWEVRRLKTIASVELSNVDKKSVEGEKSVRLCNYVDVYYNDRITPELDFMAATATADQVRRFSLRAGDVLITKDSESWTDIAVPAVVTSDLPEVLCGYHLALVRPRPGCHGAFLARAFSAIGLRDQFEVAANGITRFGLGGDAIQTGLFAVPPLEEQRAIAAFLDQETARIDALVAKKERLIDLLQEKRTALITRAATRGIDPNVSMKDSGVEWLREIPEHWEVKRLKHLALAPGSGIQMGPFGSMLKELVFSDTGYKLYGQENTISGDFEKGARWLSEQQYRDLRQYWIREGDIVVTRKGSIGNARIVPHDCEPGIIDSDTIRIRVDRDVLNSLFLALLLHEASYVYHQIGAVRRGAVLGGLNTATIADLIVAVPPREEQVELMARIRDHQGSIDRLIATIRNAIDRLKELRTALISAAVTGKIDVREKAA